MKEIDLLTRPLPTDSSHWIKCGGFDTRGSRGVASYFSWCNLAFEIAALRGVPLVGISTGIATWDAWSKALVNTRGLEEMHLYDCYTDVRKFTQKQVAMYVKAPKFHSVCIGSKNEIEAIKPNTEGMTDGISQKVEFKTLDKAYDWANAPFLGVVLKLDIEGSEWAALDALPNLKFLADKVMLLDIEAHWCMPKHGLVGHAMRKSILKHLTWMNRHFHVAGRAGDFGHEDPDYTKAGCADGQYQFLSISYYNKRLGHGEARIENYRYADPNGLDAGQFEGGIDTHGNVVS
jgi:hypothetical protein